VHNQISSMQSTTVRVEVEISPPRGHPTPERRSDSPFTYPVGLTPGGGTV
jgi:hypothetical protein